jgi:hypothetical protein
MMARFIVDGLDAAGLGAAVAAASQDIYRPYAAGVVVGSAVYQRTDGVADRTNAGAVSTSDPFLGFVMALDTPSVGTAQIRTRGDLGGFSGLSVGEIYILSTTLGGIVSENDTLNPNYPDVTPGSGDVMREVGSPSSATNLFIEGSRDFTVL